MKKTSLLWLFALLLVLPLGFVSCSDDDDEGPGSAEELVGVWEPVYGRFIEKVDGKVVYEFEGALSVEDGDVERTRLNADGTYDIAEFRNNQWIWTSEVGEWSYSGNKITMKEKYDTETEVATIKSFTGNKLAIEFEDTYTDSGISYYDYSYVELTRVKE